MAPEVELELEGVSKRYGEVAALSGVSFTVRAGESVGYLGPNGAGKSTTLKLLTGLSRPNAGRVRVGGHDPIADHRSVLARVGVLVETPGVLPYLNGNDLLRYIAEVKGIPRAEQAGAIRRALKALDVEEASSRRLGDLSTGLLRRVQLAGALIGDPKVLILDEPTMGLDPAARSDLRGILRRLARDGRTILLSTHLLDDVEEVCQRVLFLRAGQLVGDESVRPEAASAAASARTLRVGLLSAFPVERISALLRGRASVEASGALEVSVQFTGGDAEQGELLKLLVAGGVPITSTTRVGSDLAARYLAKVGREGMS